MKTLSEFIKQKIIINTFESIDQEILTESLNCSILRDVAKQLRDIRQNKNEKRNQNPNSLYYGSWVNSPQFNTIFKQYGHNIAWDKITDDDITIIDTGSTNPDDNKKEDKFVRNVIKGNTKSIIIVYDKELKQYTYVIFSYGDLVSLTDKSISVGRSFGNLTQKEKLDLIRGNRIYWIDLSDPKYNVHDKRIERSENKKGLITFDPYSLQKIADDNRKRYKEMLIKMRSEKVNDDKLINRAGELINKIAQMATNIAKDPIGNADIIDKVSTLTRYVYDQRTYNPGRGSASGYYTGIHGLLPTLMKYTQALKGSRTSGSIYDGSNFKDAQTNLTNTINNIETYIKQNNIEL